MLTPQLLPSHPFPAIKAQAQTPSVAEAPTSTGGTFRHRVHSPKQLPHPPIVLLIVATGLILSEDVKPPGALLLTGLQDVSLPPRSWKNASLQLREQYNQVKPQRCEDLGFGGGRSRY